MAFPVDDILLGPATFGRLHRLDGLIWHTGEEPAFGREYAVYTALWQRSNPGSYNFRLYDGGVMLNVPYLEASGGINPSSAAWAPGRYPFLEQQLAKAGPCPQRGCPGPYRNPTMHHLQASFVGRTAQLDAGIAPAGYVADARRLIAWAEGLLNRGPAPLVHSKHGHWQSNRSDCGEWMYSRLSPQEDDVPTPELVYVPQIWRAGPHGTHLRRQPLMVKENVIDLVPAGTWIYTVAESKDGVWRLGVAEDASDPDGEGLYWMVRGAMLEQPEGAGRDPELRAAIASLVNQAIAGAPLGGTDTAELEEQRNNALRLVGELRTLALEELQRAQAGAGDLAAGIGAAIERVESR